MRKPKIIIGIVLAIALLVLGFAIIQMRKQGSVQVNLDVPDTKNLTVKIDGKEVPLNDTKPSYNLHPGDHRLSIKKPGYKDISTPFTIKPNQTVVLNISLEPNQTKPVQNTSQLPPDPNLDGFNITETRYFYNKTWALLSVADSQGLTGNVITRFDAPSNTWKIVSGPDSIFTVDQAKSWPKDVVDYLEINSLLLGEGQ